MTIAEKVLRYSIEKHASVSVDITTMDYTLGGHWANWNRGRETGEPTYESNSRNEEGKRSVWYTDFTNFRWAIPEICGFQGRAIYVDVDIILLANIQELFELPMSHPVLSLTTQQSSVMLMDCAAFKNIEAWPSLDEMKTSEMQIKDYAQILQDTDSFGELPKEWNCLDGKGFKKKKTKLVHYTDMHTQPWRPYPDKLMYKTHAHPKVEKLWFEYAQEAGKK